MSDINITYTAELDGNIRADLTKIKAELDALSNEKYPVKIDLDDKLFRSKLAQLKAAASSMSGFQVGGVSLGGSGGSGIGNNIRRQINQYTQGIQKEIDRNPVEVGVGIRRQAYRDARKQFKELGLEASEIDKLLGSSERDKVWQNMGFDVRQLKAGFSQAGKEAERFAKLTVTGVREAEDGMKQYVKLTRTFDRKTGEVKEGLYPWSRENKEFTIDYEKQAKEQAANLKRQQREEAAASKARAQQEKKNWEYRQKWLKEVDQRGRLPKQEAVKANDDIKRLQSQAASLEKGLINKPLANAEQQAQSLKYIRSMREEMERFPNANKAMTDNIQSRMDNISKMVDGYRKAETSAQKEIDRQVKSSEKAMDSYNRKFEKLNTGVLGENDSAMQNYVQNLEKVKTLTEQTRNLSPTDDNYKQKIGELKTATEDLGRSYDTLARKIKNVSSEQKAFGREANSVQSQIQHIMDKNQNLAGTSYGDSLQNLMNEIQIKQEAGHIFSSEELAGYRTQIQGITSAAADAGKMGKTMGQSIVGAFKKFGGWQLVTHSMMRVVSTIKQMINNVRELDAAMVELKKVTTASDTAYEQFFDRAKTRAKETGATLTDTIRATADAAKLGLTIPEAEQMADAAIVYKNVGDGIESIDDASQSIISTMKAFGMETYESMSVVDKFNEVSNHFAVTSQGLGEALVRSASALSAGGNTLDESIGLITGANTILQDPQKVGELMRLAA